MKVVIVLLLAFLGGWIFMTQSHSAAQVATPGIESTPVSRSSHQDLIDLAQNEATSDLEHRVLADGVVTAREYEEAVDAYSACMADAGYEVKTTEAMFLPGMYQYEFQLGDDDSTPVPDSEFEKLRETSDRCSVGTTMLIEAVYGSQVSNPNGVDSMTLTIDCLVATDVVVEGEITAAELEAELASEQPDLPFDLGDMQAMSCMVNPAQNGLNGNPFIEVTPIASPTP